MPGIVAGRLGVQGIMVIEGPSLDSDPNSGLLVGSTDDAIIARATAPRGGLSTILKISPTTGAWLKQRNPLLRDVAFPAAGKVRVMVCENGVCREEGLEEEMGELGLGERRGEEHVPTASEEVKELETVSGQADGPVSDSADKLL